MYYDGSIHIEEDDQCFSCEYFLKGVSCPLLEALALEVVQLNTDITVRNCGFYKKFERKLKLVGDEATESSDDDEIDIQFTPDEGDDPEESSKKG